MSDVVVRRACPADLPALLAIYNHYVVNTPITFDIEPRTLEQRREWFDQFSDAGRHQCFAAVRAGEPVGWACSVKFKERAAYEFSVETSIYVKAGGHGKGIGRRLYAQLFDALAGEDVHLAFGGITLPNEGSVGVHRAFGFEYVGTLREVGRKFGRYWDVAWYQKVLG